MKAWPVVVLAAMILAGCAHPRAKHGAITQAPGTRGVVDNTSAPQSQRYHQARDGSPEDADIRRIEQLPLPVPKVEPRSRYGNKSPYTVLGRTYTVLPSAQGYHERGIASWYGTKFHGHLTSSFEPYDMYSFTAAHKSLPLPTYARVTNLDNGKSVVVRVNDRGPFHENRLIDLSYAAAVRLGIWQKGTGLVDVEVIEPADAAGAASPPPAVEVASRARLYLQVGAFADAGNAERLAAQLRAMQTGEVRVVTAEVNGRTLRRVRIGPLDSVDIADRLADRIHQQGLPRAQAIVE